MKKEDIVKKLNNRYRSDGKPLYQVEFGSAGRGISYEVMTKIKEEKLPGILFVNDLKRYYPNGVFASHLIGYALKRIMAMELPSQKAKWVLNIRIIKS